MNEPPATQLLDRRPGLPRAGHNAPSLQDVVLAILAILVIISEYQRTRPGAWLWDFGSFVESGRAAREGLNPYGVYPLTFRVVLPGFEAWNPNLNPPVSALLFQFFGLAEPHLMFRVWYWISLVLYAATVALLCLRFRDAPRLVLAIWAVALAGFWDTLLLGQIYVPLVLVGVAGWLLLDRGATIGAGVLIGLVVAMKPNFAVWPVLLLLSGFFRPALVSLLTAALISAVPLVALGPEVYRQWFELISSDTERAFFLTNASLTGLTSRIGLPELGLLLSLLLLAAAGLWALLGRRSASEVSAIAVIVALLASPIAWVHYTLFLLPIFWSKWRLDGIRVAAALLIVPVPFVIGQFGRSAWTQFTIGSVYNWALLLLLVLLLKEELERSGAPSFRSAWWRRSAPAASGSRQAW